MDNISYHGTNKHSANKIIGPPSAVDVNIGKGELGKGFYTGSSLAMATIWAQQRYNSDAVVIEFDIPKEKFVQLKGHLIKTKEKVVETWNNLKRNDETATFSFGYDYLMAPFATIDDAGKQFKFESPKAEKELNSSQKQIYDANFN